MFLISHFARVAFEVLFQRQFVRWKYSVRCSYWDFSQKWISCPLKALVSYKVLYWKPYFSGMTDGRQMFLYALKGPLYVADYNKIVSEKWCQADHCKWKPNQRHYCTDLIEKKKKPKQQDVIQWYGWKLFQSSFWTTQTFSDVFHPKIQPKVRELHVWSIETCVMRWGGRGIGSWVPQMWVMQYWTFFQCDLE